MIDKVVPKGKWAFNESVASCFDNMLSRSIPNYQDMRALTKLVVDKYRKKYLPANISLLDIGCSNGINIELFADDTNIECYGIDISEPMIAKAKERFETNTNVHILKHDIREGISALSKQFHVITSVLTLQFVPMEYRQDVLADIYESLPSNGLFVIVEKTLGANASINSLLVDSYYAIKNDNGYSYDDINRKKKSLEGVLVPCTSKWNKDLLEQAGFRQVETFWKYLNFEGILAKKGSC